jgi:phosphatidate phosphatase APP1
VNRLSFAGENNADAAALQEVRNNSNAIVSDLSDTIWALKKESLPLTAVSDRLKIFIQRIQNSYPGVSLMWKKISPKIIRFHHRRVSIFFKPCRKPSTMH